MFAFLFALLLGTGALAAEVGPEPEPSEPIAQWKRARNVGTAGALTAAVGTGLLLPIGNISGARTVAMLAVPGGTMWTVAGPMIALSGLRRVKIARANGLNLSPIPGFAALGANIVGTGVIVGVLSRDRVVLALEWVPVGVITGSVGIAGGIVWHFILNRSTADLIAKVESNAPPVAIMPWVDKNTRGLQLVGMF